MPVPHLTSRAPEEVDVVEECGYLARRRNRHVERRLPNQVWPVPFGYGDDLSGQRTRESAVSVVLHVRLHGVEDVLASGRQPDGSPVLGEVGRAEVNPSAFV